MGLLKYVLVLSVVSTHVWADLPDYLANRIKCKKPEVTTANSQSDIELRKTLSTLGISLTTPVSKANQRQFLLEHKKFPATLAKELIDHDAEIHLMEGSGVTVDPSWPQVTNTFDGRSWDQVPGSGGKPGSSPTRIVANHLYDNHGSVNLFLHEHAHTLDQLYSENVISLSKTWTELLINNSEATAFLNVICGSYCTDNINEGFAELFAYYHACEETKAEVNKLLPNFAKFFESLKSVKEFRKQDKLP